MDEGIDCCHTAQLVIYSRGVDKDFITSKELAALQSMKGLTAGREIYSELIIV